MQLTARIKNKSTVWAVNQKPRVLDVVSYLGDYYVNISGINSSPTDTTNWLRMTNNSVTPETINKTAADINASGSDWVIDLTTDSPPAFPIKVMVYVDIDGTGDFQPVDPVNYTPGTHILAGMNSPSAFPDQVVKILII